MNENSSRKLRRFLLLALMGGLIALPFLGRIGILTGNGEPVLSGPVPGVDRATVFYFYSDQCPACRQMEPGFEQAVRRCDGGPVVFQRVDVWSREGRPVGERFRVRAIPTTVFVSEDGREQERRVGYFSPGGIEEGIERLTGTTCS